MQILKWHLTDSQELFDYHYKHFPELFQVFVDKPIEYSINSDGFRSDFEYTPNKNLEVDVFLGCSHTIGSGHYWENTWPFIVSQYTGNIIVNLGIGGSGIETAFYNLLKYAHYFNVKNIFHFQPVYPRYDFIDYVTRNFYEGKDFKFFPFQPQWDGDDPDYSPYSQDYQHRVMVTDRYMYYNHIRYTYAIQGIAKELKVPYFFHHVYPKGPWVPKMVFDYDFVLTNKEGRKCVGITNSYGELVPKGDLLARDSSHMTKNEIKCVGNEFIHLKKEYPEGFVHKIPYMEKIFPKNSP